MIRGFLFDKLYELTPPKEPEYRYLKDILEPKNVVPDKYILGNGTWKTLKRHRKHHEKIGQGFGYGLNKKPFINHSRILSARYHKDGAEILIHRGLLRRPRRLTPFECSKLMGFPVEYQAFFNREEENRSQPVSDTQAYRQFGNSAG